MRIEHNIHPRPMAAPDPMIYFPVNILYEDGRESLLNVDAYVISSENEIIAYASVYYPSPGNYYRSSLSPRRPEFIGRSRESTMNCNFLATFSKSAINKIEADRMKNEFNDINLK